MSGRILSSLNTRFNSKVGVVTSSICWSTWVEVLLTIGFVAHGRLVMIMVALGSLQPCTNSKTLPSFFVPVHPRLPATGPHPLLGSSPLPVLWPPGAEGGGRGQRYFWLTSLCCLIGEGGPVGCGHLDIGPETT